MKADCRLVQQHNWATGGRLRNLRMVLHRRHCTKDGPSKAVEAKGAAIEEARTLEERLWRPAYPRYDDKIASLESLAPGTRSTMSDSTVQVSLCQDTRRGLSGPRHWRVYQDEGLAGQEEWN